MCVGVFVLVSGYMLKKGFQNTKRAFLSFGSKGQDQVLFVWEESCTRLLRGSGDCCLSVSMCVCVCMCVVCRIKCWRGQTSSEKQMPIGEEKQLVFMQGFLAILIFSLSLREDLCMEEVCMCMCVCSGWQQTRGGATDNNLHTHKQRQQARGQKIS